jgi:hypothetical protein
MARVEDRGRVVPQAPQAEVSGLQAWVGHVPHPEELRLCWKLQLLLDLTVPAEAADIVQQVLRGPCDRVEILAAA